MIVTCEACGSTFSSPFGNKQYCNSRCRERAQRKRARLRCAQVALEGVERRTDVFVVIHNPTTAQLYYVAEAYLREITKMASMFTGHIPEWLCPEGVSFTRQFDGSYVMWDMAVTMAERNPDSVQNGPGRKLTTAEVDEMLARGEYPEPDQL